MAAAHGKRLFGELEKRSSARTGKITGWRARYVGPDTERHSQTFGDKMAAEAWLNAERILIDRDQWTSPKAREAAARLASQRSVTLGDWAWRCIANKTLRPNTHRRYTKMLEQRILPVLGDIPLRDLTRADVADWYTALRVTLANEARERIAKGRKGATPDGRGVLFSAYQVLSSILNDAVAHELLDASPAKVKGGLQYEAVHEPVVLTPAQMWRLTELMPHQLAAVIPLAATTGLRNGELRALRRRHLVLDDPARAVVQVRGTAPTHRGPDSPGVAEPKTKRSKRDVAIPSFVVPFLKEHLERFAGDGPDGFVFPGRYGDVLNRSGFDDHWHPARDALGLGDLHIHDLRHTALTWAARAGATLAELMAIAGHANPTIVLHYQHVGDEERRHSIAEKVGAVFQDELAQRRARRTDVVEIPATSVATDH